MTITKAQTDNMSSKENSLLCYDIGALIRRKGKRWWDKCPTLRADMDDTHPCIIEDRMKDIQLYEMCHTDNPLRPVSGGVAPTLQARLGTGGNNVPVLVSKGFDSYNCCETGDVGPTLPAQNASRANGPRVYSFDSLASNSMKSKNPNSGCREVQVSKCIDTLNPDPSKNQGGIAIVDSYCLAGNTIDRKIENGGNGAGFQKDVSYTLNTIDKHAVCAVGVKDGKTDTITASYSKGTGTRNGKERPMVAPEARVRRLTPLECERLQGLPDNWTNIGEATDSKRYKAIGNGMAQPCADFVLSQIAAYAEE